MFDFLKFLGSKAQKKPENMNELPEYIRTSFQGNINRFNSKSSNLCKNILDAFEDVRNSANGRLKGKKLTASYLEKINSRLVMESPNPLNWHSADEFLKKATAAVMALDRIDVHPRKLIRTHKEEMDEVLMRIKLARESIEDLNRFLVSESKIGDGEEAVSMVKSVNNTQYEIETITQSIQEQKQNRDLLELKKAKLNLQLDSIRKSLVYQQLETMKKEKLDLQEELKQIESNIRSELSRISRQIKKFAHNPSGNLNSKVIDLYVTDSFTNFLQREDNEFKQLVSDLMKSKSSLGLDQKEIKKIEQVYKNINNLFQLKIRHQYVTPKIQEVMQKLERWRQPQDESVVEGEIMSIILEISQIQKLVDSLVIEKEESREKLVKQKQDLNSLLEELFPDKNLKF